MPQGNEMLSIEQREIRGLNLKNLWGFIATTAVIILAVWRIVAGGAADIKEEIRSVNERVLKLESTPQLYDLRFKQLEINISALQTQLNNIDNQVRSNRRDIDEKVK